MWTRRISLFALTASMFVFGAMSPARGLNQTSGTSPEKAADFCCTLGLSCCFIPPLIQETGARSGLRSYNKG
jgi:hypothetical protein